MSSVRATSAATLLALLAGNVVSAHEAGTTVPGLLRTELERRYPSVQRWEIRELEGKRLHSAGRTDVNRMDDVAAEVVRLGARSAVRIDGHLHWYAVSGFRNVLETNRAVGAGQLLDSTAAQVASRDVLSMSCEPLVEPSLLNAKRARKSLRARDIVCADSVEARPVVARGEPVTVRYVGARVSLSSKAIARADGNVGDLLSVQNASSQAVFNAVVSGAGEVTIHE